jgi:hypothetical protein
LSGGLFALIGIDVTTRGDFLPAAFMFLAAIGCALRAHREWKREQA